MSAYAPQDILRRIDNSLLAEYAAQRDLFPDLDIAQLQQTQIEPLYEAIQGLELAQWDDVLRELRNIAIVADKRRIQQLHTALMNAGHDFPAFHKQRANFDKAMWAHLKHPDIFKGVLDFSFPFSQARHWQKFPFPAGNVPIMDQAARDGLSNRIRDYFLEYDGRGEHCHVDHHSFQDHEYLFAYPSEYPDQIPEWLENGTFDRVPHRLAFMAVFVVQRNVPALDLYIEEPLAVKCKMFELWANAILKLDNVNTKPKRSYELTPFHIREHGIVIPPDSSVTGLAVHKLRFNPSHNRSATYTIETDITDNRQAIYDELENKYLNVGYIKQVGLEVTLQADGADKKIARRFEISPSSCSLKHVDEAAVIRDFLKRTGIDTTA